MDTAFCLLLGAVGIYRLVGGSLAHIWFMVVQETGHGSEFVRMGMAMMATIIENTFLQRFSIPFLAMCSSLSNTYRFVLSKMHTIKFALPASLLVTLKLKIFEDLG
jgi:hypothetical protein